MPETLEAQDTVAEMHDETMEVEGDAAPGAAPTIQDLETADHEAKTLLEALAENEEQIAYRGKRYQDPVGLYFLQMMESGAGTLLTREKEFALSTTMVTARKKWCEMFLSPERRMDILERLHAIIDAWKARHEVDPPEDEASRSVLLARQKLRIAEELFENCDTESADDVQELMSLDQWIWKQENILGKSLKKSRGRTQMNVTENTWLTARDELIRRNLRLVIAFAKGYWKNKKDEDAFLNLIQEGNCGLAHAADKFKPELGWKFCTYATWWIRQAISKHAQRQYHPVYRVPVSVIERRKLLKEFRGEHIARFGKNPSQEEEIRALGLRSDQIEEADGIRAAKRLHAPIGDGETEFYELQEDQSAPNATREIAMAELRADILRAAKKLPFSLRKYLTKYGLQVRQVLSPSGTFVMEFDPEQYGREMTCEELRHGIMNRLTGTYGVSRALVAAQCAKVIAILQNPTHPQHEVLKKHWQEIVREAA